MTTEDISMKSRKPVEDTIITREQVVAPPDRFIDVADGELVAYFQGALPHAQGAGVSHLHEMLDGICTNSYSRLRHALEQDFAFFAAAAACSPGSDHRARDAESVCAELDAQETRFLTNFWRLLEAGHYKLLTASAWDAALAEEFLLTLPVKVNWDALDSELLPRALWPSRPEDRQSAPEELADRVLVFHRGVDVARKQGMYLTRKVDLLLTFFILQPLFRFFALLMSKLGIRRFMPEAPTYMAPEEDADAAVTDDNARKAARKAAAGIEEGRLHAASINIERKTFARTYPDGQTVLNNLTKKAELKEACFKDVIVLYRTATPQKGSKLGEDALLHDADPAFLRRNIVIKRFRSVPIADMELVFPDKNIYMPPQVFINMAITIIGAIITVFTAFRSGLSPKVIWPTLTMLGTRASQVYTTATMQRSMIEKTMQKLLYDRTVASQEAVLSTLTEEMARQRTRELLVAYCILATSATPLPPAELDGRCETFLSAQFGTNVDFTTEEALPTLLDWGLVTPATGPEASQARPGAVVAVPLQSALETLDVIWDGLYDYSNGNGGGGGSGKIASSANTILSTPGKIFGGMKSSKVDGKVKKHAEVAEAPKDEAPLRVPPTPAPSSAAGAGAGAATISASTTTATRKPAPVVVQSSQMSPGVPTVGTGSGREKKKGMFARLGLTSTPRS